MNNVKKTVSRDRLEVFNLEASLLLSNNTLISTPITLTGPIVGYLKDLKFSGNSHTPGIIPHCKKGCHKPKNSKINEDKQIKFKLPSCGNCHPIDEINLEGNNISDVEPGTIGSQASVCGKTGAPAVKRKLSTGHVTHPKASLKLTFPTQTQVARHKEDIHLLPGQLHD